MPSHVLLFRHCVRSTKDWVLWHDPNSKTAPHNLQHYVREPLPEWNTPQNWCTEQAVETVRGTGDWIADTLLRELATTTGSSPVRVRIISDTSQRDIDTALGLSLGMASRAFTDSITTLQGFDDIHYDERLFHPEYDAGDYSDYLSESCQEDAESEESRARYKRDVARRIEALDTPSLDMSETLQLLHTLVGLQNLKDAGVDPNAPIIEASDDGTELKGSVNLVSALADLAFFSRAGDIDAPFMPNATNDQIYSLLEWSSYKRSLLHVGNAHAAIKGAVMAETIFESLALENTVTVLVGHDDDLDDIATVLGLRWKLPPPYYCRDAEYGPTPPGSALHFSLDDNLVGMSFLYPVYFDSQHEQKVNVTGILEAVPVLLLDRQDTLLPSISAGKMTLLQGGLPALRQRLLSRLSVYNGATECYQGAVAAYHQRQQPSSQQHVSNGVVGGLAFAFGGMCTLLLVLLFRSGRKWSTRKSSQFEDQVHTSGPTVEGDLNAVEIS